MLTIYNPIGTPFCVVSNWVIRVYTILVWNTISGSSNLDNYFYHCLILISISHLKAPFNLLLLLLSIIYIVNLHMVRPRSCRVIYYFDTPALGRRYQSFGHVTDLPISPILTIIDKRELSVRSALTFFIVWYIKTKCILYEKIVILP